MRICALLNSIYSNLLVDVLQELNNLNINCQHDIIDITIIGATIDITISILSQARIWENSWGNMYESSVELWKQYMRSYYSCIGNWWPQWTTTMHIIGCILCAKKMFMLLMIISHTFQYSMQPNFLALVIIQMIDDQWPKHKYWIRIQKDIVEISIH